MFTRINFKWMAAPGLTLALAATLLGSTRASAQTLTASLLSPLALTSASGSTVAAGTPLTISGSSFDADEWVGVWVNVPSGTIISPDSLGQSNTEIVDGVIGLNDMGTADDDGNFSYTLDTTGLPNGTYSLVAHGLTSGKDQVLTFTIMDGPATQLSASSSAVPAGTPITISGASYEADEWISFWVNVPSGVTVPRNSLGQDNSDTVDGVVGLNAMASADDSGAFSYTLDTTGLPNGTYSLVAHGLSTGLEQVLVFTIQ